MIKNCSYLDVSTISKDDGKTESSWKKIRVRRERCEAASLRAPGFMPVAGWKHHPRVSYTPLCSLFILRLSDSPDFTRGCWSGKLWVNYGGADSVCAFTQTAPSGYILRVDMLPFLWCYVFWGAQLGKALWQLWSLSFDSRVSFRLSAI